MLRKSLKFTYRLIKKDKFHYFLNILVPEVVLVFAFLIFLGGIDEQYLVFPLIWLIFINDQDGGGYACPIKEVLR